MQGTAAGVTRQTCVVSARQVEALIRVAEACLATGTRSLNPDAATSIGTAILNI